MADEPMEQTSQLEQTVQWLGEQQRVDRGQIEGAVREIQRLLGQARDLESKLGMLEEERRQQRTLLTRVAVAEDAVRELREASATLQQQVADLGKQGEHQVLLRAAEIERDRRTLSDLGQRVNEFSRVTELAQSRIQALAEEARRERGVIEQFPSSLDELARQQGALSSRIQQVEEYRKRVESQFVTFHQGAEQLRSEIGRLDNWQRLADVRWNRQVGESQQQAQALHQLVSEQTKPIQQVSRQVAQAQEALQSLEAQVAEQAKRIEEGLSAIQRLDGLLSVLRESSNRQEQAIESQRRRSDEQTSGLFRLEEWLQRDSAQLGDLARRIDGQDARIEDLAGLIRAFEAHRQKADDTSLALQQQLREARGEFSDRLDDLRGQFYSDRQRLSSRLAELGQTELQQRRKLLALVQQEIADWSEVTRPDFSNAPAEHADGNGTAE